MNAKELAIQKGFHFEVSTETFERDYDVRVFTIRRGDVALVIVDERCPAIHRKVRGIGGKGNHKPCPFSEDFECVVTELETLGSADVRWMSSELTLLMMLGIWEAYYHKTLREKGTSVWS